MQKRICQNSGLQLSVLGTGCWAFGGGDYWGEQDQQSVNAIVHASVDHGINYFDTAEVYNEGRSEASLGEALKGVPRDKVLIGTKISPSNCYPEVMKRHCEDSLRRLQTGYIDIYMIHWPIHPHSIMHFTEDKTIIGHPPVLNEAYETLLELRASGKIRHFGVSNFNAARLADFPDQGNIAVNELPYNLLCRAVEYDTLGKCQEKGIGVIGYMALLQGILADIYPGMDDVPVWQRRTRHFDSSRTRECRHGETGCEAETNQALTDIRKISLQTGLSMSELSIRWILANPAITCTLVGSRSVKELEANVKSVSQPISRNVVDTLNRATDPVMEKLGNHFDYYESVKNDRTI